MSSCSLLTTDTSFRLTTKTTMCFLMITKSEQAPLTPPCFSSERWGPPNLSGKSGELESPKSLTSWPMKRSTWFQTLLLGLTACSSGAQDVQCVAAPLAGGSARSELLALDPRQELAVVRLELLNAEGILGECTGTLIDPDRVLTAGHCFTSDATTFEIEFRGPGGRTETIEVGEVLVHPELDLALATLGRRPSLDLGVVPIRVGFTLPQPGEVVQISGFAESRRSFVATTVRSVDTSSFTVSADGRAAACFGDSGGPTLVRDAGGEVKVVGTLSEGKASCAGSDRFIRLDAARLWLESQGLLTGSSGVLADCSLLPPTGRCFAGSAFWCNVGDRDPTVETCDSKQVCGLSTSVGFRCLDEENDRCTGVGDRGLCDGDTLLRCENGGVVRFRCAACGAVCRTSATTGSAICNAD